jgi:hypothetical protein
MLLFAAVVVDKGWWGIAPFLFHAPAWLHSHRHQWRRGAAAQRETLRANDSCGIKGNQRGNNSEEVLDPAWNQGTKEHIIRHQIHDIKKTD